MTACSPTGRCLPCCRRDARPGDSGQAATRDAAGGNRRASAATAREAARAAGAAPAADARGAAAGKNLNQILSVAS